MAAYYVEPLARGSCKAAFGPLSWANKTLLLPKRSRGLVGLDYTNRDGRFSKRGFQTYPGSKTGTGWVWQADCRDSDATKLTLFQSCETLTIPLDTAYYNSKRTRSEANNSAHNNMSSFHCTQFLENRPTQPVTCQAQLAWPQVDPFLFAPYSRVAKKKCKQGSCRQSRHFSSI